MVAREGLQIQHLLCTHLPVVPIQGFGSLGSRTIIFASHCKKLAMHSVPACMWQVMDDTAASIQDRLPKPFPLDVCETKFPTLPHGGNSS